MCAGPNLPVRYDLPSSPWSEDPGVVLVRSTNERKNPDRVALVVMVDPVRRWGGRARTS
jgi:hypothetical protein